MTPLQVTLQALIVLLAGVGALFFLVGTVGILRLPDFFTRTHAATKCDTVGAGTLLLAFALYSGFEAPTLKILILGALILLASPTSGHALARAAHRTGLEPWYGRDDR